MNKPIEKQSKTKDIAESLISYTQHMHSLSTVLRPTMFAITKEIKGVEKSVASCFERYGITVKKKKRKQRLNMTEEMSEEIMKMLKEHNAFELAMRNIPRLFLVSLVSQYDAFIGNLLRNTYDLKPDMISASQKQFTISDLCGFETIDNIKEYVVEKEVESVLRSSHEDHFVWMENRFGLPLRKDLKCWSKFIEITERRNLFVHCNGVVSSQYLSVCKTNKCEDVKIKVGSVLDVSAKYFDESYKCLFELGVKLGQVLWRKLSPDDLENADKNLIDIGYELLKEERYELANDILEFATVVLKKHSSELHRRILLVNRSIALKSIGNPSYKDVIKNEDWTACGDEFKLAEAVLNDKIKEACEIMKRIGRRGAVTEIDYKTWPLFQEFRKTLEFKTAFKKIFRKDFVLTGLHSAEDMANQSVNSSP